MKKLIILGLLNMFIITNLYAQELLVKYNSNQHALTLKANNSNITEIISKLAQQNVQLYLLDDATFKVNGNFTNEPLDQVLAKIIPSKNKYFYKVDSKKDEEMMLKNTKKTVLSRSSSVLFAMKQTGDKMSSGDKNKPKLKSANLLKNIKQPRILAQGNTKDKFKPKNVVFKGNTSMSTVKKINPATGNKVRKSDVTLPTLVLNKGLKNKKKHLVVTYKVTKDGITPITTSEEDGDYIISTEISGDQAIIGIENDKVVLANTFEDPLSYRSIYKPGKSDHKTFKAKEAFITVQMPIKYKSAVASKKLDLKLVKFKNNTNSNTFLQKIKTNQLLKKDVNTLFNVLKSAPKYDFSKLKKINQN